MDLNDNWFTEVCDECGSALSFRIIRKLHEEQTEFQKVEIFETQDYGTLLALDGYVMLTELDNFIYHEMMTHPALFSHADPRNILIIGGGDCGSLQQVLKHTTVKSVLLVEIDPRVTQLCERYFPQLCSANNDQRVEFVFQDAVQWIRSYPSDEFDVIIIDSTDPIGPATHIYSSDFYSQCLRILRDSGLVIHQSESPLIHLQSIILPMRKNFARAGFQECRTLLFPVCSYPSGWWSATMACKNGAVEFVRESDAQAGIIKTRYYTAAIHQAALALPNFIQMQLRD